MSLYVKEYRSADAASSAYLMVLHGLFGSGDNWHAVASDLRSLGHVLLPDLPNHGRSPHTGDMSYRAMASAVAETLDERGIEEVHILGHSMGGKVAMAFALAYPDRVGSLVVVDIAPRSYPAYHQDIIDTMRQVPVSTLTARNQADGYLAQGISDRGVRAFLMKNLVKAEDGTGYQWRLNLPIIDEQYAEISSWPEPDARYTGPVLFVAGGRSPYLKDATPEEMHRLFPEAAIETIPEAGHWVHAEARERFLEVVGAFIARHVEGPVERPEH